MQMDWEFYNNLVKHIDRVNSVVDICDDTMGTTRCIQPWAALHSQLGRTSGVSRFPTARFYSKFKISEEMCDRLWGDHFCVL